MKLVYLRLEILSQGQRGKTNNWFEKLTIFLNEILSIITKYTNVQ